LAAISTLPFVAKYLFWGVGAYVVGFQCTFICIIFVTFSAKKLLIAVIGLRVLKQLCACGSLELTLIALAAVMF
jgi:hypothetical protein